MALFALFFQLAGQISMPGTEGSNRKHAITSPQAFFDDGGAAKPAKAGLLSAVTFTPKPGETIEVTFSKLDLGNGKLYVYDGQKTLDSEYDDLSDETTYSLPTGTASHILTASTLPTAPIKSSSPDGALTFVYQGGSKPGAGWEAQVKSLSTEGEPLKVLFMTPGERTVQVGDEPIEFYDNGGPTGKISYEFKGSVTFTPKTSGKVIQVTFRKLALFKSSLADKNELLRIFNGRSSKALDKLLRTLLSDPVPLRLISTEEDGSLSVSLQNFTAITGEGFEATVEAITPTAMTLKSATSSAPKKLDDAYAGQTQRPLLHLMLLTDGSKNPLKLEEVTFDLTGTSAKALHELTLYTGEEASSTHRLGSVTVPEGATSVTLKLTAEQQRALAFDLNRFFVTATAGEMAASGDKISARITSVKLSGSVHQLTSPETASIKITNTFHSKEGAKDITVYSPWTFTTTMYGGHYEGGRTDQVTTFRPGKPGEKVEINFSAFDVYYSPNRLGVKGLFEVHAGTTAKGPLLWKLDETNYKSAPTLLRSTSEDGALTIVFNPKETTPGYLGKGFTASVSSALPRPMTLQSATVTGEKSTDVAIGAKDEPFLFFTLKMGGDLEPKTLDKVQLQLTGGAASFAKLYLYQLTASEEKAGRTLVGELTPTADAAILTLTKPLALKEGENFFALSADLSNTIVPETELDLALTSVTFSGKDTPITTGDPAGVRTAKAIYLLEAGATDTRSIAGPIRFYDAGGEKGKIPAKGKGSVTFIPRPGEVIRLQFYLVDLTFTDHLYIYNGREASKEKLLRHYKGTAKDLSSIVSTAEDGSITVTMEAGSTAKAGWDIEVSSIKPAPMTVTDVALVPVTPAPRLLAGAKDLPLLRLDLTVTGEYGQVTPTQLSLGKLFPEGSTPWAKIRLYSTGTEESFKQGLNVGSLTGNATEINLHDLVYSQAGTYHLFLTADVTADAQPGEQAPKLSLAPKALTISGKEHALPALSTPLSFTPAKGIHGTFVVGNVAGADYTTLSQAAADLKARGLDGAVTLKLTPGRYEEDVLLPAIPGSSSSNTLTIEPRDPGSNVTFENKHYHALEYGDGKLGYFTLDGLSHVTLRGLTFTTQEKIAPALLQLQSGSKDVTIEDCSFSAPRSIEIDQGAISLVRTTYGKSAYNDNDRLTIRRSRFVGGHTAVRASGLKTIYLPLQQGLTIESCTFTEQGTKAIYSEEIQGLVLRDNTIEARGEVGASFIGIDATLTDKALITGNRIHFGAFTGKVSSAQGIYLRASRKDNPARHHASITNNELILRADASDQVLSAIRVTDQNIIRTQILYNSARIYGASTNERNSILELIPKKDGQVTLTVSSNLFQNEAAGYVFRTNQGTTVYKPFSNNAYYSASGKYASYNGTELNESSWKTTFGDYNSKMVQTAFLGEASLLPKDFAKISFAKTSRDVPADLLGTTRKSYNGAVGAYEPHPISLPSISEGYPKPVASAGKVSALRMKLSDFGQIHYLIQPKSAAAPDVEALKAAPVSPAFAPNVEQTLSISPLNEGESYRLFYLTQDANGSLASEVKELPLELKITELVPADFEANSLGEQSLSAGTWKFSGVEVVAATDTSRPRSKHALKLSPAATISLRSLQQAFVHDGFYLKSSGEITLTATGEGGATKSKALPSTAGQWRYVGLRDLGAFTSLSIQSKGEAFLDDFGLSPLPLTLTAKPLEGKAGEPTTLSATAGGGVWPYSYQWSSSRGEAVSTDESPAVRPGHTSNYRLTLTDSWGEVRTVHQVVTIPGVAAVADFEDLALAPNSNWHGEASTDPLSSPTVSTFYSGSYAFSNTFAKDIQTWGGFAYSNQTGTSFQELFPDQFNSVVGKGANGSKTFALAYALGEKAEIKVTQAPQAVIPGVYLTNSAYLQAFAKSGAGIVSGQTGIKEGDYFLLKITAMPSGKTLEIPLFDYRDKDKREHYILDDWQWFDLSSLGEVSKLSFSFVGSNKNQRGLVTPAYVCLDDFGSEAPAKDAGALGLTPQTPQTVELAKLFLEAGLPADASKPAHFELLSNSAPELASATLSADKLQLTPLGEGQGSLLLMRRQGGKRDYLRLPLAISKTTPVDEVSLQQQIQLFPNPATSEIRLQIDGPVSIYSLTGSCLYATKSYHAGDVINVSSWTPGLYLVKTPLGTIRFLKR